MDFSAKYCTSTLNVDQLVEQQMPDEEECTVKFTNSYIDTEVTRGNKEIQFVPSRLDDRPKANDELSRILNNNYRSRSAHECGSKNSDKIQEVLQSNSLMSN